MAGQQPRPATISGIDFAYANIHRWMTAGDDVAATLPTYCTRATRPLRARTTDVHTSPDFMATYADITRQRQSLLPQVGFDQRDRHPGRYLDFFQFAAIHLQRPTCPRPRALSPKTIEAYRISLDVPA